MTEKYNDLAEFITDEIGGYQTEHSVTLNWLDRLAAEHPDRVPGRTITRSEYRDTLNGAVKVSGYGNDWERGFNTGLAVAGTKVVPDAEPTNFERLEDLVDQWRKGPKYKTLTQYLDDCGVTAPGGDE